MSLRSSSLPFRRAPQLACVAGVLLLAGLGRSQEKAAPPAPAGASEKAAPPAPAGASEKAAPPAKPAEKAAPILAGAGLRVGGGIRLDDGPIFATTQRTGIVAGGSLSLSPSHWFSVRLAYEHAELSREHVLLGPAGDASAVRRLDTLWAELRVHLLRRGSVVPLVILAPGVVWQSARVNGVGFPEPTTNVPVTFRCEATAGANFGLRAGLGIDVAASNGLVLSGQATFDNLRLSSDVLDNCVPGAGSAAVLGLQAGLAYRFDVTGLFR